MVEKELKSFEGLPEEILVIVLANLPVKSILRFMSVCKLWHRMIKYDPHFFAMHTKYVGRSLFENDTENPSRQFRQPCLCSHSSFRHYSMPRIGNTLIWSLNPGHSILDDPCDCKFVGSCNGLICLLSTYKKRDPDFDIIFDIPRSILLWNPHIRRQKTIWPVIPSNNIILSAYGFGFLDHVQDYKVVTLCRLLDERKDFAEVYSLKSNSWKQIEAIDIKFLAYDRTGIFVNGAVHWLAGDDISITERQIICFDFKEEKFQRKQCPFRKGNLPSDKVTRYYFIGKTMGLLSLITQSVDALLDFYDVWVLRDYNNEETWIKLFCIKGGDWIQIHHDHNIPIQIAPVYFGIGGEVFTRTPSNKRLIIYKGDEVIKDFKDCKLKIKDVIISCKESLTLLNC